MTMGRRSGVAKAEAGKPRLQALRLLADRHGQGFEAAQDEGAAPLRLFAEGEAREAAQQRGEGDLRFGTSERRAQAEVDAEAERDVAVLFARDVERLRVGEL